MANRLLYMVVTAMLIVTLSLAFERRAYAYVDPGSGLLIFQGISAAVSGTLIYFRRRLKALFVKTPKVNTSVPESH